MTYTGDGILYSVKAMIGGPIDFCDDSFDDELVAHINTVLSTLNQIGIGNPEFIFTGEERWTDFLGDMEESKYKQIKSYVYLRVRQLFDPPASATIANALDAQMKELEWRLYSLANY